MNILDIPYVIDIFFVVSTLVFAGALYAILPAMIYDKRAVNKPSFTYALWLKYARNFFSGLRETSFDLKKGD